MILCYREEKPFRLSDLKISLEEGQGEKGFRLCVCRGLTAFLSAHSCSPLRPGPLPRRPSSSYDPKCLGPVFLTEWSPGLNNTLTLCHSCSFGTPFLGRALGIRISPPAESQRLPLCYPELPQPQLLGRGMLHAAWCLELPSSLCTLPSVLRAWGTIL